MLLRDLLLRQKDFEWSNKRYPMDRRYSTKEGHAKKHVIELIDESKKWVKYNNICLDDDIENIINQYEQISINNVKENKYIINNVYFDENNRSLNVKDKNGLETCLKIDAKKSKLKIVSCFYRSKIRDFFDNCKNFTIDDIDIVMKFITFNDIKKQEYNIDIKDKEKMVIEFIESLKENEIDEIKYLIDSYYQKIEFNYKKVENNIIDYLNEIDEYIYNIKIQAKEYSFEFEEYQVKEYDEFGEDESNLFKIELDEKILKILDDDYKEPLELLKEDIEYETIIYFLKKLCIIYMYAIVSKKYELLDEYEKRIYFFYQLMGESRDYIYKMEKLISKEVIINNTMYTIGLKLNNYMSEKKKIELKYNYEELKSNMESIYNEYDNLGDIITYECEDCHKLFYLHSLILPEKLEWNHKDIDMGICPFCNSNNIKYILSLSDVYSNEMREFK